MLVLTRRISEEIIIGDDIVIKLLGVRGKQANFGISAPSEISVHRREIYDKIKMQNEEENEE